MQLHYTSVTICSVIINMFLLVNTMEQNLTPEHNLMSNKKNNPEHMQMVLFSPNNTEEQLNNDQIEYLENLEYLLKTALENAILDTITADNPNNVTRDFLQQQYAAYMQKNPKHDFTVYAVREYNYVMTLMNTAEVKASAKQNLMVCSYKRPSPSSDAQTTEHTKAEELDFLE